MLFDKNKFLLIAGPCAIENRDMLMKSAEALTSLSQSLQLNFIFKSSFDKANRSSATSFRGLGVETGLHMLSEIKEQFGVPVLSDIHTPEMAHAAAEILDVIQVPAFLARQTDFYLEAAKTKAVLNIKKGQFMSPYEMQNALDKFSSGGGKEAWITERGTFFGYGNLVVDFRSIKIIREMGVPYIYDATHSLQLPAARGSVSGGQREFIPSLARAQVAAGADGLFVETHPAVEQALCDRENQWPLEKMKELIEPILDIWNVIKSK